MSFTFWYKLCSTECDTWFIICLRTHLFVPEFITRSWQNGNKYAIISGILGALLFFTKSFGFPYFLALFVVAVWIRHKKYHASFSLAPAFYFSWNIFRTLFILDCSVEFEIWHANYKQSARSICQKEVASTPGQIVELPILTEGLIPPPDSLLFCLGKSRRQLRLRLFILYPSTPTVHSINKCSKEIFWAFIIPTLKEKPIRFVLIFIMFNVLFGWRAVGETRWLNFTDLSADFVWWIQFGSRTYTLCLMCTWIMLLISMDAPENSGK